MYRISGWICPICKRVWSEHIYGCSVCNNSPEEARLSANTNIEITHTPCIDADDLARRLIPLIKEALKTKQK